MIENNENQSGTDSTPKQTPIVQTVAKPVLPSRQRIITEEFLSKAQVDNLSSKRINEIE